MILLILFMNPVQYDTLKFSEGCPALFNVYYGPVWPFTYGHLMPLTYVYCPSCFSMIPNALLPPSVSVYDSFMATYCGPFPLTTFMAFYGPFVALHIPFWLIMALCGPSRAFI